MYTRGKFGIEYKPPAPKPEGSWLGRVMFVAALVVVVLVARAVWTRFTSRVPEEQVEKRGGGGQWDVSNSSVHLDSPSRPNSTTNLQPVVQLPTANNRPVRVRNLLLRLQEAERKNDVEMSVSTIEQLRATPGAADLDDALARRLGALNFKRLFDLKSAQWTTETKVKRGDFAMRIAYEHGSTLASLVKLNNVDVDKLRIGQKLTVMNHPRFNLVITRRTRTADLSLNGKFFKRYYLTDEVKGAEGSYETPERFRNFCTAMGVPFKPLDRAELEMLLPKGTAAFIKEI